MRIAAPVLLAVALACAAGEQSPDAAYRAFVRAVAERDGGRAWALLSSDTRAWLDARARAAAASAPGVVEPSGEQLLIGTAVRGSPVVNNVVVLRESRDRAVVEVEEEGGARRPVELVREEGWRVRIPPPASG